MPVKIRLQRVGKKDQALYRMVAADQHQKANGRNLEIIGSANLKSKPQKVSYDKIKLDKWLKLGGKLSESVRKLLSL